MTYKATWDLESVYSGGSNSEALHHKFDTLTTQLIRLQELVSQWIPTSEAIQSDLFQQILELSDTISEGISQTSTFSVAHLSAKQDDSYAPINLNKINLLATEFHNIYTHFTKKIESIPQKDWDKLLDTPPFQQVAFRLNEIREKAQELLSTDLEHTIAELSIDGFQAWEDMYNDLVSSVKIKIERDGVTHEYSAAQADNLLLSAKTPSERALVLSAWEEAWQHHAPLFQTVLNHLAGFRLTDYKLHNKDSYLDTPLKLNRLKKETLDTMWKTITHNKDRLVDFLNLKASLMGVDKLGWADVEAPLTVGNDQSEHYEYTEAAHFIMEHFEKVSPQMKALAKLAFERQWIEAENRSNKRPGGYCASLPESGESRIFMTFSGTPDNVSTLAHELGHAFHSYVLRSEPHLNQQYAMNVAETASTFAELIVTDATIQAAKTVEEKIKLLDQKNSRAAIMFMDIHARYLFERRFYDNRQEGLVSTNTLNALMEQAQKDAFNHSLASYHPTFWASKGHFYSTSVPFYNFPYTFGFLFSLGIYAQAEKMDTKTFEQRYINLLKDTASMTTEELALKHLDVDLTKVDFWQDAIDLIIADVDTFEQLVNDYLDEK